MKVLSKALLMILLIISYTMAADAQETLLRELIWDSSINAALQIGIYCAHLDHHITGSELTDEVYKIDRDLPDTTIDKIWKAIPKNFRKDAGRPKKRE